MSSTPRDMLKKEEKLSKRNNWSPARRTSPYPLHNCVNTFPTQEREVLKTFQDSYERLRTNRVVITTRPKSPLTTKDNGKHVVPVELNASNMNNNDNNSLSYIGMIATAILNSPETKLTLAGIYNYMEDRFYNSLSTRPGWRNTVRHNLSLHECFVKGEIAAEGKGRFWRIHPNYFEQFKCGKFNKNILQNVTPSFYRATANYHHSTRGEFEWGPFPMNYPLPGWTGLYPFIPSSYPFQVPHLHRDNPTTPHLFNPRDYRELQPFPIRQCPGDLCDVCTRVRRLPTTLCPSYAINPTLAIENGTRSSAIN